jgi:hypothetical protein
VPGHLKLRLSRNIVLSEIFLGTTKNMFDAGHPKIGNLPQSFISAADRVHQQNLVSKRLSSGGVP